MMDNKLRTRKPTIATEEATQLFADQSELTNAFGMDFARTEPTHGEFAQLSKEFIQELIVIRYDVVQNNFAFDQN
ncbi:MAG: hypothetical protein VXZ82_23030 [Planctomycetota bacterium]|nr:hypothetical protein [Planctomycetota bacterium]